MSLMMWWEILAGIVVVAILYFLISSALPKINKKPKLLLIEPLGLIVKKWQIARLTGEIAQVERVLRLYSQTTLEETVLSQVLPIAKGKLPPASLISNISMSLLGEQRLIEQKGKKTALIIGLVPEVLPHLILNATERKELSKLEDQAGEHGFLLLVVGQTAVHSSSPELRTLTYGFLGSIILEPMIDEEVVSNLKNRLEDKRLLTVLPKALTQTFCEQLDLDNKVITLNLHETAQNFDQKAENAKSISEADSEIQYRVMRILERGHALKVLSTLPSSRNLQVETTTIT